MTDLFLKLESAEGKQTAKVEVFAGAHIARACEQATRIATLLGVVVNFEFNGVDCYARPHSDWRTLQRRWEAITGTPEDKRSQFDMAWSDAPAVSETPSHE